MAFGSIPLVKRAASSGELMVRIFMHYPHYAWPIFSGQAVRYVPLRVMGTRTGLLKYR